MPNQFSIKANKRKAEKAGVSVATLLADDTSNDLVSKAKYEGRYITLSPDEFIPDPDQPRKTFDEESIKILSKSIEELGQLQPILVGKPINGKYPIIAGERRWRASHLSTNIETIDAIISDKNDDDLLVLLMQIDENNQREQTTVMENADAIKRVVDLCKSRNEDQKYAAKLLHITPARVSMYLTMVNAPDYIKELSVNGDTQDVDTLYNLTKASSHNDASVKEFIKRMKSGDIDQSLRKASKDLLDLQKPKSSSKPENSQELPKTIKVITASGITTDLTNDDYLLVVSTGKNTMKIKLDQTAAFALKNDINGKWTELNG